MSAVPHPSAALAALLLLLSGSICCVSAWRKGRATFYGNEPWYWSIHHGSCGFGYQWPDQGLGWDIVALADSHPDHPGSCGSCYEVKCESSSVKDGYGETINRDGACRDEGASVIVKTTDTCPCNYPNNYYSNKRWCCGDMDHLDLSVFAFQKLTDMKYGVIPIEYRKVDCGQQPERRACCADFPGEFPPLSEARARNEFDYYKYFPSGGYLNSKAGDGSDKVSVDDYLRRVDIRGGSSQPSSYQNGESSYQNGDSSSSSSGGSGDQSSSSSSSVRNWGGWGGFWARVFG